MMDVNLNDTFDARIWVQEWLKTIKKHPDIPTDEGTMLGWFANAIMAGYDYACREMKTKKETLREKLAELAHDQWAGWMEYLFSKGTFNEDGTWTMPVWAVERWKRQAETPYSDLSEAEKNSDRNEADKFLTVIETGGDSNGGGVSGELRGGGGSVALAGAGRGDGVSRAGGPVTGT